MNKSPMNYLIAFAIACICWILTNLVLANHLSDTIMLATLPIETFLFWYRVALTAVGVIALLTVFNWFRYGNKDAVAIELDQAKRVWYITFISLISLTVVVMMAKVVAFLNEGIAFVDYLIIFAAVALETFIYFWLCTFLLSPRTVKYVVPLKH